ncbi:MAG: S1-like domain-containing RNA-binding protein [Tolumonas sp.]|nr:S1-like domain-containing RNA-binding protein [Tolumonas sp.]
MIQLGRMNSLPIIKIDEKGAWLDADDLGHVFVPQSQLPEAIKEGSTLAVFPYLDGDSELVISADKPLAQVGEFAGLKVISASRIGAFLDWGLKKDLFVPANEQAKPMQTGHTYVVYVYLDRESRPTATSRLDHYLSIEMPQYEPWEEVDLLVCEQTDLGYKVIVNKKFWGLIFYNEIFTTIKIGQRTKGYIKKIHEDGKLDVTLNKPGLARKDEAGEKILARLQKQGGFLPVGDKSSPELIYSQFSMSKGTFKKAIGGLFKQGLITIEDGGIRLV